MQSDYKLLPKRGKRYDGSIQRLTRCRFWTNFFNVQIDPRHNKVYQYSVDIARVPDDSTEFYFKAIRSIKVRLQKDIEMKSWKGKMLWAGKKRQLPLQIKTQFTFKNQKYECDVLIKFARELNIRDLIHSSDTNIRTQIVQVLNADMKNKLGMIGMYELGKQGQYFSQDQDDQALQNLRKEGLQVLRGYRFTLTPLYGEISLQLDICSRVIQSKSLLAMFYDNKQKNIAEFSGATIVTKYGKRKTYKIEQVDYKKSPKQTFYHEKMGRLISYEEYYADSYMLRVKEQKQPLLKVEGRIKKEMKHGKIIQTPQYIYLIPEFVSLTGMTDKQREDYNVMKLLDPFTKLTPEQRCRSSRDMKEKFNLVEGGMISIGENKQMNGYILNQPAIILHNKKSITPDYRGSMKLRNKLKSVVQLEQRKWAFAYSIGKKPQIDDDQADKAYDLLKKAGEAYGITIGTPQFVCVQAGGFESWRTQIEQAIENKKKKDEEFKLIVCFLTPREQKYYGQLKSYLTNQIQISSQMIRRKTLKHPKGALSAASKIDIQINTKIGGVPWQVSKTHPYFKNRSVMYGALSLSKGKKGYTLAFVGTRNPDKTQFYSQCRHIQRKQQIPPDELNKIFINWAKAYYKTAKTVPQLVMVYREGLSDAQVSVQLPNEIQALETMVQKMTKATKTPNYNPELVYILAEKKTTARFYVERGGVMNPPSGSVVIEEMSKDDEFDFHLAAQYVNQGTCTPTHYTVAYENRKMSPGAFMAFTYEQCFNYYNWEGAIRVPACLQYANKLAKLAGEGIMGDIVQGEISKTLHFL